MIEVLIASMCVMSELKQNACGTALEAYRQQSIWIKTMETRINNDIVKPAPDDLKYVGGAAGILYNRRLKVKLYRGFFVDLREGQEMVGYELKF